MSCAASALLLEGREHLAAEQLARRDARRVVELVAQRLPLDVHAREEVRQPADARLRQHERQPGCRSSAPQNTMVASGSSSCSGSSVANAADCHLPSR